MNTSKESHAAEGLVTHAVETFGKANPLYKLPEFTGDRLYYPYSADDAAFDVLIEDGFDPRSDMWKLHLLREATRQQIRNYELIMQMRGVLAHKLNERVHIRPVIDRKR